MTEDIFTGILEAYRKDEISITKAKRQIRLLLDPKSTSEVVNKNTALRSVMRFKFISGDKILIEIDATPHYPRTGNYIWINERRYQVIAVHVDYDPNEMRFYCV